MLKSKVGYSSLDDAKAAGKEAALMAKGSESETKLAYVYCSCAFDVKEVLHGVAEVLPTCSLVGNTSFTGVVTPGGYIGGDTPFVGIMTVGSEEMSVGTAIVEASDCAYSAGVKLAHDAMSAAGKDVAPKYFYMVASPKEEEDYLKGISSVIGRIPFFGGSAADNSIAGEWSLYEGETVISDGCAVAFVYDAPDMDNKFSDAYKETDDYGVITKVEGKRVLMEIDGKPACEKYMEWTGCSKEDVSGGNLLVTTITSPLGVKDRLGDLTAIRHPMNGNEDGSMNIGNNLAEKTCIIRMEATIDELISSVETTLQELLDGLDHKPSALHLVHCGGRRAGIGDRIGEVADIVAKVAGDIPYIMEFTFGEYGFVSDENNTCGGLMLSFTAL
ncbi:FIST signal transduction protein [Tannockella kyphosi]|uniref:FIST signal transduction protein n=1 Tax=Tannockella kyphosi TaxID=2899121 RepID=UPI002010C7C5|nr:FIST N-terminal domain-containing protein [Tannockella kyphosi]